MSFHSNSADFGLRSASTSSAMDPWGTLELGSMAEGGPTPVLATAPLSTSYEEYSQSWVQAAQEGLTPGDIKALVDSLGNWVKAEVAQVRSEMGSEVNRLKEALRRRKTEVKTLQEQIDSLDQTRQHLATQIAEAQTQNRVLQSAMQALQQENENLKMLVQQGTSGGNVGLSQSLFPTMKEPDTFNGDKASKLDDWLESMALWLRHRGVTNDEKKIETAMTYLRGSAKKVMQEYFDKVADSKPLGTWTNFVNDLQKGFQQTDKKDRARAEFEQLVSKKGTNEKTFNEFAARFRSLARQTGFSNEELLVKAYAHTPRAAADVLAARGRAQWATTWDGWLRDVQEILQDQRLLTGTVLSGQPHSSKDPDAMDVDALKKGSNQSKGKVSKVQKVAMSFEEAKKKGCCAQCGGKGHIAKECPTKKNASGSSASSSKTTNAPVASSSKASSSKGKEKDKGSRYTKNSVREVYASDSERFQEVSSDEESSSDSSEEEDTPKAKQKKKSSSKEKTQKINRVVFSDDEDFLQGPM